MNLNEYIIIGLFVLLILGALWIKYQENIRYQKEIDDQYLKSLQVKITNIQGQVEDAYVDPNMLDKSITDSYPDELGFPEPAGKGIKNLIPEQSMIDTYYSDITDNGIPINNVKLPIGACPFSRPMSRDLPIANVSMCMATDIKSDMRLH
jgi:uncharacterized membrane-anchored protein YhcB (DUF1043 family)